MLFLKYLIWQIFGFMDGRNRYGICIGRFSQIILRESYVLPLKIPLILVVNFYTIGMLHAKSTYKSTLGLFKYGQYILIFTGIINLLDVILGSEFGIFGIYVATLIARLCTNLWYELFMLYIAMA